MNKKNSIAQAGSTVEKNNIKIMNVPELGFLLTLQEYLDNEIIVSQEKCPTHKHQLNILYNRINGFINSLKRQIK